MNPEVVKTQHRRPFPFEDRLVIEYVREEKSAGGIVLPEAVEAETQQKKQQELTIDIGKVLAVGAGAFTDAGVQVPMPIKPGDMVAYPRHKVIKYKLDGETYLLTSMQCILAIIDESPYDQPTVNEDDCGIDEDEEEECTLQGPG